MRYLIYSLFVVLTLGLYSCDTSKQGSENESGVSLMKANWADTTALAKSIDVFYKDSVFKKGKISLEIRDPFLRKAHPYQYLQLQKIKRADFKLSTPTIGYMPVLMSAGPDSAIVDFQITWQQISPQDSAGQFVVTDRFLHTIKNQLRYEWTKEGEYWIRKNVEAPKGLLEERERKLNTVQQQDAI